MRYIVLLLLAAGAIAVLYGLRHQLRSRLGRALRVGTTVYFALMAGRLVLAPHEPDAFLMLGLVLALCAATWGAVYLAVELWLRQRPSRPPLPPPAPARRWRRPARR